MSSRFLNWSSESAATTEGGSVLGNEIEILLQEEMRKINQANLI